MMMIGSLDRHYALRLVFLYLMDMKDRGNGHRF